MPPMLKKKTELERRFSWTRNLTGTGRVILFSIGMGPPTAHSRAFSRSHMTDAVTVTHCHAHMCDLHRPQSHPVWGGRPPNAHRDVRPTGDAPGVGHPHPAGGASASLRVPLMCLSQGRSCGKALQGCRSVRHQFLDQSSLIHKGFQLLQPLGCPE